MVIKMQIQDIKETIAGDSVAIEWITSWNVSFTD